MVSIRLSRVGRKRVPLWRVVAADSEAPRDGKYLEVLGTYDSTRNPVGLRLNQDRIAYWISKGAQPSDTVRSLLKQYKKAATAQN